MSEGGLSAAELAAAGWAGVEKALGRFDRAPFRRVLAEYIGAAPTPQAIAEFAAKYPDRWAQGLAILAGLAGFQKDVNVNVTHWNVAEMSEAQLMERARELGLDPHLTIEGVATRVPPPITAANVSYTPHFSELPIEVGANLHSAQNCGQESAVDGDNSEMPTNPTRMQNSTAIAENRLRPGADTPEREQNVGGGVKVPTFIPNGKMP